MFAETEPYKKRCDYKKLVKGLDPPPPPSTEEAWELQFCKWWGWNWVKKKEIENDLTAASGQNKKPQKKAIKNLCQTLCFKKKKEQQPLQNMYNTPSNSVINEYNRKPTSFPSSSNNTASGSTVEPSKTKNGYRTCSNTVGSENEYKMPQCNKKKKGKECSSSDDCCVCNNVKTAGSGDSIEYINIMCCPCCHSKASAVPLSSQKKSAHTQGNLCQCKMMATQTEEQKSRRRRICIVCCNCGKNVPRCCPCDANKRAKRECAGRGGTDQYSCECSQKPTIGEETTNVYRTSITKDTSTQFQKKLEPLYITRTPMDKMLYLNKPLPKFKRASNSYSWIHAAKSDIWDQFSHFRLNHQLTTPVSKKYNLHSNIWDKLTDIRENSKFSSPLSGKTYHISPVKVEHLESKPSILFNPLDVDEELASLKKIESDVKMDLKSRIMLDAVCDAILNKEPDTDSSIFMNEFTYPSTITQTECTKDTIESGPLFTSTKLNEWDLNNTFFEKPIDKHCESKVVHSEKNTTNINTILNNLQHDSTRDYSRVCPPSTRTVENHFTSINESLKETKNPCKLLDYTIKNDQHLISMGKPPSCSTITAKRRASQTPRNRDTKKVKLQGPPTLSSVNNSNVTDIFKKIDEIVSRSKVNSDEIQTVLHNIPKRSFQFFSSWEISNMIHSNSPLHPLREIKPSDSSFTTVSDEKPPIIENIKNNQEQRIVKKKNAAHRPSLIPKRCAQPKAFKRHVN